MQLLLLWFLGLGWLRSAFADLTFTSPLSSSVFTATTGITVAWQGSTAGAPISQLGATTFYLCSGSTASSTTLMTLTAGISPGTTTTFTSGEIDPAKGPSGKYYFITAKTTYQNADVYYYSDYFTINGLTGGFASSVISALSAAGMWAATSTLSTSAASTSTTDVATTAEASSVTEVGSMALSYFLLLWPTGTMRDYYLSQSNSIVYAPMQPKPGTTFTAASTISSPLWDSSSYTVYTTLVPCSYRISTVTPGWSYTYTLVVNDGETASAPTHLPTVTTFGTSTTLTNKRRDAWNDPNDLRRRAMRVPLHNKGFYNR